MCDGPRPVMEIAYHTRAVYFQQEQALGALGRLRAQDDHDLRMVGPYMPVRHVRLQHLREQARRVIGAGEVLVDDDEAEAALIGVRIRVARREAPRVEADVAQNRRIQRGKAGGVLPVADLYGRVLALQLWIGEQA